MQTLQRPRAEGGTWANYVSLKKARDLPLSTVTHGIQAFTPWGEYRKARVSEKMDLARRWPYSS